MRKKILSIILLAVMVFTMLAGCGNKAESAGGNSNNDSSAQTEVKGDTAAGGEIKKVGFTVPSVGSDFILAITESVKAALAEKGIECQVDSADGDVTKQIEQIENYAMMDMDMIVVFPINGEALTNTCKKIMNDQNIPIIAFAMEIPDGATTQMLSAEEGDMGQMCAQMTSEWIDKTFPDAGDGEVTVYMMTASNSPEASERTEGMMDIKDNPKVNLITEETDDWNSADTARNRMENAFLTTPDIDVVMAINATCATGIDAYVSSADCKIEDKSKFGIFLVDETTEVVEKIKASANNESLIRGTISMGSIEDTTNDFMSAIEPILEGKEPYEVWNGGAKILTVDTMAE